MNRRRRTRDVDEFVDAKASGFNKLQQAEWVYAQTLHLKASKNRALPNVSITRSYLIRDQEAGGSNPLAPTFCFSKDTARFGLPPERALVDLVDEISSRIYQLPYRQESELGNWRTSVTFKLSRCFSLECRGKQEILRLQHPLIGAVPTGMAPTDTWSVPARAAVRLTTRISPRIRPERRSGVNHREEREYGIHCNR